MGSPELHDLVRRVHRASSPLGYGVVRDGSHVGRLPAREPTPKSSHPLPITHRRRLRFSEVQLFLLRVLYSLGPISFALPKVSSDPHYVSPAYLSCTIILGR